MLYIYANYPNRYSDAAFQKHQFEKTRCQVSPYKDNQYSKYWNFKHLFLPKFVGILRSLRIKWLWKHQKGQSILWLLTKYLTPSACKRTSFPEEVDLPGIFALLLLIKPEKRGPSMSPLASSTLTCYTWAAYLFFN